jgi:hypothetical protein
MVKVVFLTNDDLNDLMTTALEGGINHWCNEAKATVECNGWISDALVVGYAINLYDSETHEPYQLTLSGLMKGIELYSGKHQLPMDDNRLDLGQIDAAIADCIIQYAVFGEVRYA